MKLKSVLNFRDVGGMPSSGNGNIRKGQIFRSATIDNIKNEDISMLRDFGIRTIIDLRAPKEAKKSRKTVNDIVALSLPLDFQQTTRERLKPFLYKKGSEEILADISNKLYLDILDAASPVLKQIMELLVSDNGAPVLIHCQAGKDRTGIIIALVLLALGVDRQLISEDFMKSNDELLPYFKKLLLIRKIITFGYFPAKRMLYVITVKERNINSVIDRVDSHYGGIEGYLALSGFEVSKLVDLRKKFCTI